jgi:predicted CxxxxCH...CXXCH cytochrome family protein
VKISNTHTTSLRVLVALTLTFISLAGLPGKAEAASCLTCHAAVGSTADIRPEEQAPFRNITTGSIKGSHAKHIPAPTLSASACTPCHGAAAATYSTNHRDGFITVTSAGGIGYSKPTSFPQSGSKDLVLGTCSAASCHNNVYGAGSVTTPVWGDSAANCSACHTTPIGTTGPATGSHANVTSHAVACTTCHSTGTTATTMPTVGHNDSNITIVNVGYPATVVKHVAGSGYTTCSTASCHLNVYGDVSVTTPVWGTSASCNACHTVTIDATGPNTGSHAKHNDTTCTDCHYAGATATAKPSIGHADGTISVTNGYPVTVKHVAGSYTGTCSTTCHSATIAPGATPVWGTPGDCATCHASAPNTGSHTNHLTYRVGGFSWETGHRTYTPNIFVCADCHNGAVQDLNSGTAHTNNNIDVSNGYPATVAKHEAGSGYSTCATSYCHSSGQSLTDGNDATPVYSSTTPPIITPPAWGAAAMSCGKCHATAGFLHSGSHDRHVSVFSLACSKCHDGVSPASYFSTSHINKSIDVSAGLKYELSPGVSAAGAPGNGYGTCSTSSCHDNGKGVPVVTPVWGAFYNNVSTCSACHNGVPADATHTKHVTTTTAQKVNCSGCHDGYTWVGGVTGADHLNGTVEVNTGTYPSPKAKGSAVGSCSTSYCHSSGQSANGQSATPVYATVAWGGTPLLCGSCHAGLTINTGSHGKHVAADNRCENCHYGMNVTNNSYNSGFHVDGKINVNFSVGTYSEGFPSAPGNGYGTCSSVSCHNTIDPRGAWGTVTNNDTCTACHGTPTPTGTITVTNRYLVAPSDASAGDKGKVSLNLKTGAHQTHIQYLNGLSNQGTEDNRCSACHGPLPSSASHSFGSPLWASDPTYTFDESGLAVAKGEGAIWPNYVGGSCSNTYCHNPAGTGGTLNPLNAGTGTTPSWINAGYIEDGTLKTDSNCNRCHLSPGNPSFSLTSSHTGVTITNDCAACHGHNGDATGVVGQQHIDGIRFANGACDSCHGYPPVSTSQLTVVQAAGTFANARLENYSGGGGYHTSHLAPTIVVGDEFKPCLPCHPSTVHMQGGSTVTRANVNVNYDAADTSLRFDGTRSKRYTNTDVKWTCSNISCHFKPSPAWNL